LSSDSSIGHIFIQFFCGNHKCVFLRVHECVQRAHIPRPEVNNDVSAMCTRTRSTGSRAVTCFLRRPNPRPVTRDVFLRPRNPRALGRHMGACVCARRPVTLSLGATSISRPAVSMSWIDGS